MDLYERAGFNLGGYLILRKKGQEVAAHQNASDKCHGATLYGCLRTYHPGPIEHLLPPIKQAGRSTGNNPRVGRQLLKPGNATGKRMLGSTNDGEPIIEEWFLK